LRIVGARSTAPPLVGYSDEALEEMFRDTLESFTKPMAMAHQVHTYTELRQQIHDDLRIQHPEWVQPNGESPMCDFYEARLMGLLADLPEVRAHSTRAVLVHEREQRLIRFCKAKANPREVLRSRRP
jgi:hypothetical protein